MITLNTTSKNNSNTYYYLNAELRAKPRKTSSKHAKTNKKHNNYFATPEEAFKTAHQIKKVYKRPQIINKYQDMTRNLEDNYETKIAYHKKSIAEAEKEIKYLKQCNYSLDEALEERKRTTNTIILAFFVYTIIGIVVLAGAVQ